MKLNLGKCEKSYRVRFRNREPRSYIALSGKPQNSHIYISQVVHTSKVFRIKNPVRFSCCIIHTVLNKSVRTTDLGVVFNRKIDFKLHLFGVIAKAFSMLGFMKRWGKEFNNPLVTRHLYITIVRPILEYKTSLN